VIFQGSEKVAGRRNIRALNAHDSIACYKPTKDIATAGLQTCLRRCATGQHAPKQDTLQISTLHHAIRE
tara:strand:+ start:539 stop:745 length:207 start_codon:yes stop_codon:yes gene_type:complete